MACCCLVYAILDLRASWPRVTRPNLSVFVFHCLPPLFLVPPPPPPPRGCLVVSCSFRLPPALSGGFFSAFFFLFSPGRTVTFDVSHFPNTQSRVDIAKLIKTRFCSTYSVESVQFMPGGTVQVSFAEPIAKTAIETVKFVTSGDVLVFHYPFEGGNKALMDFFGAYGEIEEVRLQGYPHLQGVSTGTRIVRMIRKLQIPRSMEIKGFNCKVWYKGIPLECDICSEGHVARDCPLKGKGHVARNCPNDVHAWDTSSNDVSAPVSTDPTPAEAASSDTPAPPQAVASYWGCGPSDNKHSDDEYQDTRDNELDELQKPVRLASTV